MSLRAFFAKQSPTNTGLLRRKERSSQRHGVFNIPLPNTKFVPFVQFEKFVLKRYLQQCPRAYNPGMLTGSRPWAGISPHNTSASACIELSRML